VLLKLCSNETVRRNTVPATPSSPANSKQIRPQSLFTNPSLHIRICNIWTWRYLSGNRAAITDIARKTDTMLTLGGRRFGFGYSLSWHHNARTGLLILPSRYMVISFLLLNVTVSCESTKMSKATRQLLHRLAFNICNLGLFGIELKPGVGLRLKA